MRTMAPPGLPPVHEAWLPREHPLHRPRHSRRQLVSLFFALIFFATPLAARAIGGEPAEFENRPLATFPSVATGWNFWTALPTWAEDNLVFRRNAIQSADFISRTIFREPPPLATHRDRSGPIGTAPEGESHNIPVPTVIEGSDGWMYFGQDVVARCEQANSLDVTMAQLDKLRAGIESSGRQFIAVIAPDKTTMVPQHLPGRYPGKECRERVTADLWQRATGRDYIVDLRADLRRWEAQSGRSPYPKLDSHWNDEGGVALTQAIAESMRPGVTASWRIDPSQSWRVPGDLPPLIGRTGDITGTFYALRPDGLTNTASPVPTDFTRERAPLHLTHARGQGTIAQRVGMAGDSFTIRALRYLGAAFADISIVHAGKAESEGPHVIAGLFARQEVVVIEFAERTLASGDHVLLSQETIEAITSELARHPIR